MPGETSAMNIAPVRVAWLAAAALAAVVAGCEEDTYGHRPPAGMGAIVLDNFTGDDINVFIDGQSVGRLDDYDDRAFDLAPGLHRVVLDARSSPRYGAWDVDVIADRLTVIRIRVASWNWREYDGEFSVRTP